MKKKLYMFLLTLITATSLSGCGNNSDYSPNSDSNQPMESTESSTISPTTNATPTEDPEVVAQKKAAEEQALLDDKFGSDYEKAVKLYEDKNYKEAQDLFNTMRSYKDSADYISQIGIAVYDEMETLLADGNYSEAIDLGTLIDEQWEYKNYSDVVALIDMAKKKKAQIEGYSKEELPNGYFIKKGERFYPIPDARDDGFFDGNADQLMFIDADKYHEDMFMHISSHDTIIFKGSKDNGLGMYFTSVGDACGYTYEVAIDDDGAVTIRNDDIVIDGDIEYVNDMKFWDWQRKMSGEWDQYTYYFAHNHSAFENYYVFIHDIPKGDKIKVGYFNDKSDYIEKEYEANLWALSYDTGGGGYRTLAFEPTKDGYFSSDFEFYKEYYGEMSGLYWFKLSNDEEHKFLLWFD